MEIRFRDRRPPHEVAFSLERDLMALLRPETEDGQLVFRGTARPGVGDYRFELRLEAAHLLQNCYLLRVEPPAGDNSAEGWFRFWTRDFKPAPPPDGHNQDSSRYRALAEQAHAAASRFPDVAAVQREIVAALRSGAHFATAHKEGGTTIRARGSGFIRADYGESSDTERFAGEEAFLAWLRQFFHWQVTRNSSGSELDAWKLILRLLQR